MFTQRWARSTLLILILPLLGACASGHCRSRGDGGPKSVFVFKPDGTKQCGIGSATTVEQMSAELGDIKILSKENKSDGKLYPMVCGAPTGKVNVYEIPSKDLDQAIAAGFKEFKK